MEFDEIKDLIVKNSKRYSKKHKVKMDKDVLMLKLYEEAGELTQAFLINERKSRPEKFISSKKAREAVASELADVFSIVVLLSKYLNVDLKEALEKKIFYKVRNK